MIPLRDHNRPDSFPYLTYGLIAANVLVFFYQARGPEGEEEKLVREMGLKPAFVVAYLRGERSIEYLERSIEHNPSGQMRLVQRQRSSRLDFWNSLFPFLASMFLHGGIGHLLSNVWFLHIFGDNVEDRLGHFRYLFFYVGTGLTASITQVVVSPDSAIPCVGASGAISGVLGGYAFLFPHARVLTLVPVFIFLQFMEIPAFIFLFIWFGLQVLQGFLSDPGMGGVAWWAHIGGFVAGMVLVKLFPQRPPTKI